MTAGSAVTLALLMGVLALGCGSQSGPSSSASGGSSTSNAGTSASTGHAGTSASAGHGGAATGDAPTWYGEIAPLVSQHCQSCHVPSGIAPFSLQTYEEAKRMSPAFDAALRSGEMPPFLAKDTPDCKPRFGWQDDLRLTDAQIELFKRWNDAGCPEGDPSTASSLPAPPDLQLKEAAVRVATTTPVTIEGPGDRFVCYSLAPDLSPLKSTGVLAELLGDQVLVGGAQIHAGNPAIVHHVLVFTDEDGESAALAGDKGYYDCFGGPRVSSPGLVMAWAPGATPVTTPESVAMAVPTKGRLVMQVHYHPTSEPQVDVGTSLDLRGYGSDVPAYISTLALVGNFGKKDADGFGLQPGPSDASTPEFRIPAGAVGHTESMRFKVPETAPEYRLWLVASHMHYVGTEMRIGVTRTASPTQPADECLLATPGWSFEWQRSYRYDVAIEDAPTLTAGDIIDMRCTYDNSMGNPHVAEALAEQGLSAPRDVLLGEETLDEMCLGVFGVAQKVSDLLK